jgi:plasmid stability protein
MVSLTIRNIPEEILKRIRIFAVRERRSLNSEILIMIEAGLAGRIAQETGKSLAGEGTTSGGISQVVRETLWKDFAGQWSDNRPIQEIIRDTYTMRSGVEPNDPS